MEYLKDGTLPGDRKEASKLCIKARQYELLEGVLYRRSFLKPWLRCVGPLQANYVIREIHERSCSMYAGPRFVVAKAMRLGRTKKAQVFDSRYGLFHKVNRGESHGNNHRQSAIREANSKLKMIKYYNTRVRGVTFRPGDFVYRSNEASHAMDRGKLGPKWEGPYEVTEVLRDGAYRLRSMDGTVLLRT
nr:reverse transcriptase domain-containing protein [Tanacetum cinerariifolium]